MICCLKYVLDKLCPGVDYSSRGCEFNVSETTLLVNKVSADRRAQKTWFLWPDATSILHWKQWLCSAAVISVLTKSHLGKEELCHTGYRPPLREVRAGTSGRSLKGKPCQNEWRSLSYSLWLFWLVFLSIPGSPSRDVLPTVNWALTYQFQFLKTVSHTCAQTILTGQFFTWYSFFPGLLNWWQRLAIALSIQ